MLYVPRGNQRRANESVTFRKTLFNPIMGVVGASEPPPPQVFRVPLRNGWAGTFWLLTDIHRGHSVKFLAQGQVRSPCHVTWPFFKKVCNHVMATVSVGSVWNLQDCVRPSVQKKKRIPRKSCPGDLVTDGGQFTNLPIISLATIWKCFPFRISRSLPPKSFRILTTHTTCADQGVTDDRGHGRSPEVTWGQMR